MEGCVILAHELNKLHLVAVFILPPFLPVRGQVGRYREITDWCVEPDIEDFLFEFLKRYLDSPFEISRDTSLLESFL